MAEHSASTVRLPGMNGDVAYEETNTTCPISGKKLYAMRTTPLSPQQSEYQFVIISPTATPAAGKTASPVSLRGDLAGTTKLMPSGKTMLGYTLQFVGNDGTNTVRILSASGNDVTYASSSLNRVERPKNEGGWEDVRIDCVGTAVCLVSILMK